MLPSTESQKPWSQWHQRLHKKLLSDRKLLPKGAYLLLSVSGGQDSMALLKLMIDLSRLHQWSLEVWHGDHGWHEGSKTIAKELTTWCEERNLKIHCDSTNKVVTKSESLAREWRYENLAKRATQISTKNKNHPCRHVLTAHTASDRAETLILNLARGTDLAGLGSLRNQRILKGKIHLVRPLLEFSRSETAAICKEMELPVWIDPSNKNPDFSRNRVRKEIVPVLEDLHPGCCLRIASLSERFAEQKDDQHSLLTMALTTLKSSEGLNRESLGTLPVSIRKSLLFFWLQQEGVKGLTSTHLEDLIIKTVTGKPPGSISLSKGRKISWTKKLIRLE